MRLCPTFVAKPLLLMATLLVPGAAAGPAAHAGVTSLLVDSEPGEPLGRGEFNYYTPEEGRFFLPPSLPTPSPAVPENEVRSSFSGFSVSWSLRFAAPPDESLTVGVYENAVRVSSRQPGQPGIDVFSARGGIARGCNGTTGGRFEVKEIAFDPDSVPTSFWATFEHTCAGAVLRGEIRFNANVPVVLVAPSRRNVLEGRNLSFGVEGFDRLGLPLTLTASGLPPGSLFDDAGDGTGAFAWTAAPGQSGLYWLATHGESVTDVTDTIYTRIDALPDFDDIDHAVPFSPPPFPDSTLPFVSEADSPEASRAGDDPLCLDPPLGMEWGTVWYAFTPQEDLRINGRIVSSLSPVPLPPPDRSTAMSVYTGERGALEQIVCHHDYARFDATAGETYYIMAGLPEPGSPLVFLAEQLPPPPVNDDFDDATVITALPFSDDVGTGGAIAERDDPGPCGDEPQDPNVWYAYTPAADTPVWINATASSITARITVFTGQRGALVPIVCGTSRVSFLALAGEAYSVMISGGSNGTVGPGFGTIIGTPGSLGGLLRIAFSHEPPIDIGIAIDASNRFDPHGGSAMIHGTTTCSRPGTIDVFGILQRGNDKALGTFHATVECSGATRWSAEVPAIPVLDLRPRFTGGPATIRFNARGWPTDLPNDVVLIDGQAVVKLKGSDSR